MVELSYQYLEYDVDDSLFQSTIIMVLIMMTKDISVH